MNRSWKVAAAAVFALAAGAAQATTIVFNDFSSVAGLQLNGNAARAGNVLRVTPSLPGQAGSAFSTTAVSLASNVSFSTYFRFRISNPGGIGDESLQGADGLVFVVQTVSNTAGGAGGGIGYLGINDSVGVEFDTYNNCGCGPTEPNGNHVGIDLGGSVASTASATEAVPFNDGQVWNAWVDYNGATTTLEARWSPAAIRPLLPQLSLVVDLASELTTTNAFVGFTSGTGAGYNDHDILSWEFRDTFNPVQTPIPGTLALFGVAFGLLGWNRRRSR
jgi:hypothetical protein